ncbi:MAG: AEC family transporter, partial [Lachnospiraceae bacterium]|nr:AEC family transporter [Lachnospiraceae bacterium]
DGISTSNNGQSSDVKKKSKAAMMKKIFLSPALIAGFLCIIMGITKFQGPEFLAETFDCVGGITTPGALLVIGSSLAEMPFKEMFTNVKAYLFAIMQVIVTPLVMYLLYRPICGDNSLLLGETVIIAAMPVATAGTMLCVEYGGAEKLMAQITFITTLATVVTIPLLATLL